MQRYCYSFEYCILSFKFARDDIKFCAWIMKKREKRKKEKRKKLQSVLSSLKSYFFCCSVLPSLPISKTVFVQDTPASSVLLLNIWREAATKNLVVTCAFVFKPAETVGVCQQLLSILVYVLFKLTEDHAAPPFGLQQPNSIFKVNFYSWSGSNTYDHLFAR